MAWQQYSPYLSWSAVPNPHDQYGDLGLTSPSYVEDTSYHGQTGSSYRPGSISYGEGYEMDDRRSYISSAPLLQPDEQPIYKSSIREPSVYEPSSKDVKLGRHHLSGWKIGVSVCAATAVFVCLLNITLTLWAVINHKVEDGLSYLYTGSCQEVATMSLWIHLGINAMSTMLLSASNYTMQVISSPTRKEVDKAHARTKWLDIGIPSTRNLRAISWTRVVMWAVLGMSSIPLHLMYNTAVFSSLSANGYYYTVVSKNFITSNASGVDSGIMHTLHESVMNGKFFNYTNEQCITAYSTNFVSKYRNVVLVTSGNDEKYFSSDNYNSSFYDYSQWSTYEQVPFAWTCGDSWSFNPYESTPHDAVCTLSAALEGASHWTVAQHLINYCLVEEVSESCQLSFSLYIMLVVIGVNASKACIMILTVWKLKEPTLVTIGDAVSSFLREPDTTTRGICLASKQDIQNNRWKLQPAKPWTPKKHFWFRAASVKRWLTCNLLCTGFIGFGIYLLSLGMTQINIYNISELYALGFGTVSANSVVSVAPSGLLATTLFANLPQAILSFLYLTYNGLFSCMLGSYEWIRFGRFRKSLRVTAPVGNQRSTYYLQLPYTYAIPLLLLSGGLHWLMSQSLFLALVTVYDQAGDRDDSDSISTVGYSCIAIFCALILGSVAVLGGIANGFRRFDDSIPLVGSCSAAISAACHKLPHDTDAQLNTIMWGVVDPGGSGEEVGHCAFCSFEVGKPVVGDRKSVV